MGLNSYYEIMDTRLSPYASVEFRNLPDLSQIEQMIFNSWWLHNSNKAEARRQIFFESPPWIFPVSISNRLAYEFTDLIFAEVTDKRLELEGT